MARYYKKNNALIGGVLAAGAFILLRNVAMRGARRTVVQNVVADDEEADYGPHYQKTLSDTGLYFWGENAEEVQSAIQTGKNYVLVTEDGCWRPVEDNLCYSFWIASQIHEKDVMNSGNEEYSFFIDTSLESSGFEAPAQLPALMVVSDGQISEQILGEEAILQYLAANFPMTY